MEMHQKDIQENDPFGQNDDEADEADDDEKSFLKALLAERALKNVNKQLTYYRSFSFVNLAKAISQQ